MSHTVFVTLRVKPDSMDTLCAEVAQVATRARTEEGCLTFEPNRPVDGSARVLFFERWANKDAFDAHEAQPYMRELYARLGRMLDGAPEVIQVAPVQG